MEFVHKLNICPLKLYKKLGKTLNTNYGLDTITYEDLKKNITVDESWHKYMLLKNLKENDMKTTNLDGVKPNERGHIDNDHYYKSIGNFKRLRENEIRHKQKKKIKNRKRRNNE